jgi:hypothetical protein
MPRSTAPLPLDPTGPGLDGIVLVYDSDSGLWSMLLDVAKKAVGREDCALCAITYGPTGKRSGWTACESRLGIPVSEMHRDQLPSSWGLGAADLPCIVARSEGRSPTVLLGRAEIVACQGSAASLETALRRALERPGQPGPTEVERRARG